ncbi:stress response serine/threonine protein kinase YihE [Halioglobus japonicus]|uniref:Stress response kinase A n=1 Tax=Halioglobus japonicus TaxID=930805 RepID=A0AAP8MC86_9GAMM|nr:serine/threonine protein kinase [Halioglobus japonicus]AQA17221.1 stress response serine/threonine protein kinase YihE [Halioglobus japonicus]PLW85135.1 serine/threonine protein kinase [Halioglobus japonicus]GHD19634.1 stress response kinase A [Halioglobus japonicus]
MSEHPYDRLTPDMVIDAVESTGRLSDARLLALNSYENRVYQVGIEDGEPLIAKFYRPDRWTMAQIEEEHAFSLELQAADISVVAPMADEQGTTLHTYEGFQIALFPRRGGYPPELDNLDNMLILGRTLGRIHAVGKANSFEHRQRIDIDRMLAANREYLLENFIPKELEPAYSSLTADLLQAVTEQYQPAPEDETRVHGDCHVGNILWRDDVAHFVDLDDCSTAPAMQDLWMFLNGERHERELQLCELIEGYEEFCDFDARQLRWVEPLRTLRLVNYAAWLARRWDDPAFPRAFTWFNTERYWAEHILELREQMAALQEEPLRLL